MPGVKTTEVRVTTRFLLVAAAMDFLIIKLIAAVAFIPLSERFGDALGLGVAPPMALSLIISAVGYWALTEMCLFGLSPGRVCLGLSPEVTTSSVSANRAFLKRFAMKAGTLGLSGLMPDRIAWYDERSKIRWVALLGPSLPPESETRPLPIGSWAIRIDAPPFNGRPVKLSKFDSFRSQRVVRFGRDKDWSDVKLDRFPKISGKHCAIRFIGSTVEIRDFGTDGKGSKNGTMLHGRRLPPGKWIDIGGATHFHIANIKVGLIRYSSAKRELRRSR